MKNLFALLLALCLVLSAFSAVADVEYPVEADTTLTIWKILDGDTANGGYTTSMDTPGFKAWCENTGISVELKEFSDGTSLVLALNAATTLPDMVMINAGSFYNGGITGMINDGLVMEITEDMLEQYAPNYWLFINDDIYLNEMLQLDGKMYYLAGHVFEEASMYRYWRGLFYRADILEAIGKDVPQTIDEFYDVLVAMKEYGVETPLVFQGKNDLRDSMKNGEFVSGFGLVSTGEYQADGVWHYGAYEPEYKDVLEFMNKLYNEGLISVDYASMEEATSRAMFCNGQAGVMYGNNSRLNTYLGSLQEGGSMVGGYVLKAEGMDRAMYSYADAMTTKDDITYITVDCQNVELCLEFYNYLFTLDGSMIRNFGTEGVSYVWNEEDGSISYTEYVTNNPNGYSMDGVARTEALINWPGIHANAQLALRHPQPTQLVAYERWSDTDHDKYVVVHTSVLDEYVNEYTDLWTDIDLYINECRAKFVSGEMSLDDFDSYIETLASMGMDRVVEIKQITLDAHNAALDK